MTQMTMTLRDRFTTVFAALRGNDSNKPNIEGPDGPTTRNKFINDWCMNVNDGKMLPAWFHDPETTDESREKFLDAIESALEEDDWSPFGGEAAPVKEEGPEEPEPTIKLDGKTHSELMLEHDEEIERKAITESHHPVNPPADPAFLAGIIAENEETDGKVLRLHVTIPVPIADLARALAPIVAAHIGTPSSAGITEERAQEIADKAAKSVTSKILKALG